MREAARPAYAFEGGRGIFCQSEKVHGGLRRKRESSLCGISTRKTESCIVAMRTAAANVLGPCYSVESAGLPCS